MFKWKENQVTFSGLGSVCPVFVIHIHLLPTHRQLSVTTKQPLCLPGQGGEIYPTHSTWERTWIGLESEGTWRAFLFHLLSHQNPLQTKDSPAHKKLGVCNGSRSFKTPASSHLLSVDSQARLSAKRSRLCHPITKKRKKNEGLRNQKIQVCVYIYVFTSATSWYLVSRSGIATAPPAPTR